MWARTGGIYECRLGYLFYPCKHLVFCVFLFLFVYVQNVEIVLVLRLRIGSVVQNAFTFVSKRHFSYLGDPGRGE